MKISFAVPNQVLAVVGFAVVAFVVGRVSAAEFPAANTEMFYSGQLTDTSGVPQTASQDFLVELFTSLAGGSSLCIHSESNVSLAATNGHFRFALPADCVDAIRDNGDVFAQLTVGTTTFPRQKLGASAFAVVARDALRADVATTANSAALAAGVEAGAVGPGAFAPNAVASGDIANAAVTAGKIASGAVGSAQLAADAVSTGSIQNLSVTSAKIASGAIGGAQLGSNAVDSANLANLAVSSAKIADSAVVVSKIADGAVSTPKIEAAFVGRVATLETRPVLVSAFVTGTTAAPAATVVSQEIDNFLSGNCAHPSIGHYVCTFTPGYWGAPPHCLVQMVVGTLVPTVTAPSTSSTDVDMANVSGALVDGSYLLICTGFKS